MNHPESLRTLAGLICGTLLGAGLYVSGMTDPGKVLGFRDFGGPWNPTLIGVLGGAVVVSLLGFQWLIKPMRRPWLDSQFHTPTRRDIDRPLVLGALMFGAGWGLSGYCPGPALAGIALGNWETPVLITAMLAGGVAQKWWADRHQPR